MSKSKKYCVVCGIKCKGFTVKLHNNHYVHNQCFVCHLCSAPLDLQKFYIKENNLYCPHDFKNSFSPHCGYCGETIEKEYVACLNNKYHLGCLKCSVCGTLCKQGDILSYDGDRFICQKCSRGSNTKTNNNSTNEKHSVNSMGFLKDSKECMARDSAKNDAMHEADASNLKKMLFDHQNNKKREGTRTASLNHDNVSIFSQASFKLVSQGYALKPGYGLKPIAYACFSSPSTPMKTSYSDSVSFEGPELKSATCDAFYDEALNYDIDPYTGLKRTPLRLILPTPKKNEQKDNKNKNNTNNHKNNKNNNNNNDNNSNNNNKSLREIVEARGPPITVIDLLKKTKPFPACQ